MLDNERPKAIPTRTKKKYGIPMDWQRIALLTAFAQVTEPRTDREAFDASGLPPDFNFYVACNRLRKWKLIKHADMVKPEGDHLDSSRSAITERGRFILAAHLKYLRKAGKVPHA